MAAGRTDNALLTLPLPQSVAPPPTLAISYVGGPDPGYSQRVAKAAPIRVNTFNIPRDSLVLDGMQNTLV